MYIPWRINNELELTASDAIEKIAYVTKSRRSLFYFLGLSFADWNNRFDRVLFDGVVNKERRTFHLTTASGRYSIVLQGIVQGRVKGSVFRAWVLPPAYMLLAALFFAILILVNVVRHPKPQEDPYIILKMAVAMLSFFGLVFWLIRLKAESVLKNLFAGKLAKPLSEQLPWPELPNHFAIQPIRPDHEPEMIPTPDPTLVEHFEALSHDILAHSATPPHMLRVDTYKENLSLRFPPRSGDGFEVSVEVDNAGATIFASGKEVVAFTLERDSSETFVIITDTFRLVRALLSPEIQIRVFLVNGMIVKVKQETIDEKGKVHSYSIWKTPDRIASGLKTERLLINRHMPRPN